MYSPFVCAIIFPLSLLYFLQHKLFILKVLNHHQLLVTIKDILHPKGATLKDTLRERAYPNQRLVRALGLTNTFVSDDEAVHKKFVAEAHRLIGNAQCKGWAHFQAIARDAVQWQLTQHDDLDLSSPLLKFEFDSFVQNITLIVVLVGILQVDEPISTFSVQDLELVAKNITTLWGLSKKSDPVPLHFLDDLNAHLRRLVPDEEAFPNPLDFVVPAWETLWRVVATTVAYSHNNGEILRVFEEFNECPSDDVFRSSSRGTGSIDAKSVVTEAMRLHPPSRRIGRAKATWIQTWCPRLLKEWITTSGLVSNTNAEIGALLRLCDLWGPDADTFVPGRHVVGKVLNEQKEASTFVFGHGPLRCIASSWAPMAAAIIAGAMLEALGSDEYVLEAGADIGGRARWKGWLVRRL